MLLTAAENKRDSLTIILAGYKDEIEGKLYTSDAGFKSRFRQVEGGGDRHSWDEKKGQARSHGTRVLFAERRVRRAYATSSLPRVQVTFEDFNYPELRVILKGLIDKYSWTCQVCAFNMAYTSDGARMLSARCGRVHKSDATDVCSSRLHLIVPAIPTLYHSLFFFRLHVAVVYRRPRQDPRVVDVAARRVARGRGVKGFANARTCRTALERAYQAALDRGDVTQEYHTVRQKAQETNARRGH